MTAAMSSHAFHTGAEAIPQGTPAHEALESLQTNILCQSIYDAPYPPLKYH